MDLAMCASPKRVKPSIYDRMLKVVCGVIWSNDGKVLLARRKPGKSMAGKWEFPGGKIETGEPEEEALKRELMEELGMTVSVHEKIGEFPFQYPSGSILLIAYRCTFLSATFRLSDHDKVIWLGTADLMQYDLAAADLPIIAHLLT